MAYETRQTLKNFFLTGRKPTEAQFAALIDSLFSINDDSGRMVRDLLQDTIFGNDRLDRSAIKGVDRSVNFRGIGDLYDPQFRAGMNTPEPIRIGDMWIMGSNNSAPEGDTANLKIDDWVIAIQDDASISNFGDTSKWYVVRIGTNITPKEFELITINSGTIDLKSKPSDKLKFEHKTTSGTIVLNSFGTGLPGLNKKLWIELKSDSAYKIQINSVNIGSAGIFIPGISTSGNVTYTGNPVNTNLNHIFVDAVCIGSNQWIVVNISQATSSGPKSPETDQVQLSGDYYLTFFENQIFPNCILTADAELNADFENEIFTNGSRIVMLIDGNDHELTFGSGFSVVLGQFNQAAGCFNLVDIIYNPILGAKVSIYNDLPESTTNKENTTIDSSTTKYPTVALLKTVYDSWLNQQWYGIEWDTSVSSPDCARIGNGDLHRSLPVQSAFRACLLNDDGTVNYYLNQNDWDSKEGSGDSDLSGTDGQVMIEIPEHYRRFESDGGFKRRFMVSQFPLSGYTKVNKQYISAFEASLDRVNLKLSSVVNASADYRGGSNTSAWDAEDRTLLGRPVSNLSRTQFRTYARARGSKWNLYHYEANLTLSYLFFLEYATLNSQKAYNAAKDLNGYMQGGLGNGITDLNSTNWNTWNSYNPFINCGYSNSIGTKSGVQSFVMPAGYGATLTTYVNRYRGIELPFGHIWKYTDGVTVNAQAAGVGASEHQFYLAADPASWNDANLTGYTKMAALPRVDGYIKEMINGHIMPSINSGAGSTTYFCDYFYQSIPASGEALRSVLFCGHAYAGAAAGFACSNAKYPPSSADAIIGSRLCCI